MAWELTYLTPLKKDKFRMSWGSCSAGGQWKLSKSGMMFTPASMAATISCKSIHINIGLCWYQEWKLTLLTILHNKTLHCPNTESWINQVQAKMNIREERTPVS